MQQDQRVFCKGLARDLCDTVQKLDRSPLRWGPARAYD